MIPQIEPWIDESELVQLRRVVESTYVVEHKLTTEFEGLLRDLTGASRAVAVTNGTAALYCCLKALGIGPGDEVIVPGLTFVATANAVIMAGAEPVLCDADGESMCMDAGDMERRITDRTRAVIPVHLYGQCADMDAIIEITRRHGVMIIEDAAQSVGVTFQGRHAGTFGAMGVLSFYGNKTITCGEGGAILTDDSELADKCYRLKNHGRLKKGVFVHEEIGFNFSFTEMQAAVGISQMGKLKAIIGKKNEIHDLYENELAGIDGLRSIKVDPRCSPVHWFTSFLSDDRDRLAEFLGENGIQTRAFFCPLHLQPCYQNRNFGARGAFPVSERLYETGISLPSSYGLSSGDQGKVIEKIKEFHTLR